MSERGIFLPGFAISRAGRVSDGAGGWTTGFVPSSTVRGRLSPLSLAETQRAEQSIGVVTHRFSTSSNSDVKKDDRVARGGLTVDVKAVSTTSTGQRKQCLCEEVNDAS